MRTMKMISIFGYYGFKNTGDDSVLQSLLYDIRNIGYEGQITVFSNCEDETEELYKKFNVSCVKWNDFELLNIVIKQSDLLIIGGGGLYNCYLDYPENLFLKGNHSYFSVINFELPYIAHMYHVPCMILGVGASDIQSKLAKVHIGYSLKYLDKITVRDVGTKEILSQLPGTDGIEINVTADPVFRLVSGELLEKENQLLTEIDTLPKPLIGVSLRNWFGEVDVARETARSINEFCSTYGGSVVCLSFDDGKVVDNLSSDSTVFQGFLHEVDANIKTIYPREYLRPEYAKAIINRCSIMICMRLHPLVMSISNAIPVVGISYDSKVRRMMKECGIEENCIDLADVERNALLKKIVGIYENRNLICEHERIVSGDMKERAYSNVVYIKKVLDSGLANNNDYLLEQLGLLFYEQKLLNIKERAEVLFNQNEMFEYIKLMKHLPIEELTPQEIYHKAFAFHQIDNTKEALVWYDLALKHGFDEFWVKFNRGQLRVNIGEVELGRQDLRDAYRINPNHEGISKLIKEGEN